jgi:hypothetical protein
MISVLSLLARTWMSKHVYFGLGGNTGYGILCMRFPGDVRVLY